MNQTKRGGSMNKHFVAPIALSAVVLGIVGGGIYAGSALSAPAHKPAQVELVQPASQVVPAPDPAIANMKAAKADAAKAAKAKADAKAAAKKKAAVAAAKKAAVKVVKVESAQAPAPKPVTVQRQAVVSDPTPVTPDPSVTPEPVVTPTPAATPNPQPRSGGAQSWTSPGLPGAPTDATPEPPTPPAPAN